MPEAPHGAPTRTSIPRGWEPSVQEHGIILGETTGEEGGQFLRTVSVDLRGRVAVPMALAQGRLRTGLSRVCRRLEPMKREQTVGSAKGRREC